MSARRALGMAAAAWLAAAPFQAQAQDEGVETLQAMFARFGACWRPPVQDGQPGFQITVMVTLRRDGTIFGKPKITFETPGVAESRRLAYRIAVKEMLDRCTPMPLRAGLGEAIAGRPLRLRFDDRRIPLSPAERKA